MTSTTLRMMKLTTPDQTMVASVPYELDPDLAGVAVDAGRTGPRRRPRHGEDAGQDGADEAADAVDAEGVERVVVAERALQPRHRPEADDAGDDADDQRAGRVDAAGGRRDGDQAGDRAGDDAEHARLAAHDPLGEHPGERGGGGGDLGDGHGHAGAAVGGELRSRR